MFFDSPRKDYGCSFEFLHVQCCLDLFGRLVQPKLSMVLLLCLLTLMCCPPCRFGFPEHLKKGDKFSQFLMYHCDYHLLWPLLDFAIFLHSYAVKLQIQLAQFSWIPCAYLLSLCVITVMFWSSCSAGLADPYI